MANLPIDGTHDLQTRYTEEVVALKRKQNVVRKFFNTDFVGDPKAGAVKFTMRPSEVAVNDYNVKEGADMTFGETEYKNVLIEKNEAINELIDGYEAQAVPDNLVAQRLESGAYSLGRKQEMNAISVLEGNATAETDETETGANDVYEGIIQSIKNVKNKGVDKDTLVVVISDEVEAKLLTDEKYSNTAAAMGADLVREGIVSRIGGVDVVVSSNLDDGSVSNSETEWIVFSTLFAATAEDWMVEPQIYDLRNGKHIGSSALQGRVVYEDVLLDTDAARIKTVDRA